MRGVLFLADELDRPGEGMQESGRYFVDTIPALVAAGVKLVPCFVGPRHPAAEELQARGVEPVFLAARSFDPLVLGRVAHLAQEHHCGVIHAHGPKSTLIGRTVGRCTGKRLLVHVHDLELPSPSARALNSALASASDVGLCVSQAAIEVAVRGYALRPERTRVVHTGVRIGPFRPDFSHRARARVRGELGIGPEVPVLAMVARFDPEKRHREMLKMMHTIRQRCPGAVLLVAGDGPERERCEALAHTLGLEHSVRFLGTRRDVADVLAASDLVVVPSLAEGLGRVAIEANLVGRKVVGFDGGGLAEVLAPLDTGAAVPRGDAQRFISAVCHLLTHPALHDGSRARARRMGGAALRHACLRKAAARVL